MLLFPVAAFADINSTATVNAGSNFSLDNGTNVSSGGDISFTGTSLTYVGIAKGGSLAALGLSGTSGFATVTQTILTSLASFSTTTPIPAASLPVGTIVGVGTNGGNVAKLLITAISASSISFQYTTYESTAPNTPTITQIQNNYSLLVSGLPNYGIAPGTLFIIRGTNLASVPVSSITKLQDSTAAGGIPTTLNGATITVTVGSFTAHPGMYYAGATQIAAVLPSGTPTGTGTITVSYNNATSNAATLTVVTSALGLDTYYGGGTGLGVATDATTYSVFSYTSSAKPLENIVFWGSGLGADTADSDVMYTTTPHAISTPLTIYIGGIQATILYQGSSGFPGLNQINVTIPSSVATGCGISVVAVTGTGSASVVSNLMTLPISANGGVCVDTGALGYNGTTLSGTTSNNGSSTGILSIVQTTTPVSGTSGGLVTAAGADFIRYPPTTNTPNSGGGVTSLGNCSISGTINVTTGTAPTLTGLDAGNITIKGPTASQQLTNAVIPGQSGPTGEYYYILANSFFPPTGGTFIFTGTGGKDVGAFTASISYTNPMVWTNMSAISTVTRASGQSITWTGGTPGTYVYIDGSSSSAAASANFFCYAPVSAGQFTIPNYILLALPAGNSGSLAVGSYGTPGSFTASGLTTGLIEAGVSFSISPNYN